MPNTALKPTALFDVDRELSKTRRLLERIPDDKLGWKPHEKSWTLGQLGAHIANLPTWKTMSLTTDGFDMAAPQPSRAEPTSSTEILEAFDKNVADFNSAYEGANDDVLTSMWSLRHGDHVISSDPKHEVLRQWGISHMIHHRGQLSVYLRLLNVPLPPIYGPTADENPS